MSQVVEAKSQGLVAKFAEGLGVEADKLLPTLRNTAFRQSGNNQVTNEQLMALLIVANEHGLNPFTKEIYAFPDKGGIVPVVSVDGWSRIINENPQMDGIEFSYSEETRTINGKKVHDWIECIIYRKDRRVPIRVREFFDEVYRSNAGPWQSHPNRMHRHKAEIQCARVAFGFAGIYDLDEAERIVEVSGEPQVVAGKKIYPKKYSDEQKAYYDDLLDKSNGLGLYLFKESIDEATWNDLYHSFDRGQKGKMQGLVNSLYEAGRNKAIDIETSINDHAEQGNDFAIAELLEGMGDDEIRYFLGAVGPEGAQAMQAVMRQMNEDKGEQQ